jgi:hypothetical protein
MRRGPLRGYDLARFHPLINRQKWVGCGRSLQLSNIASDRPLPGPIETFSDVNGGDLAERPLPGVLETLSELRMPRTRPAWYGQNRTLLYILVGYVSELKPREPA